MLYIGAVEPAARFLGPKHVYMMSDKQAGLSTDAARIDYAVAAAKNGFASLGKPWYANNTREPIRDEGIRQFLLSVGAATERQDLPKTSPHGRYALTKEFAALFDPALGAAPFKAAMDKWAKAHLSAGALARIELVRAGAGAEHTGMMVEFPNKGGSRPLEAGPSSVISKAVIEEFARRFLLKPMVVLLSQSGNKVVSRDDLLAKKIGINIDHAKLLPDIILVDMGLPEVFIVFVEAVASDGPISEDRRKELRALVAKHNEDHIAYVTAFADRDTKEFRRVFESLAWNSFAWLVSEPDKIIALFEIQDPARNKLHHLVASTRSPAES